MCGRFCPVSNLREVPEMTTINRTKYQLTFEWQNGDWTWIDVEADDFHQAMLIALDKCPLGGRIHNITYI